MNKDEIVLALALPELQHEAAKNLINEIKSEIDRLEDLDPLFLLDMMGVCGLEFRIGEGASHAFLQILSGSVKVK